MGSSLSRAIRRAVANAKDAIRLYQQFVELSGGRSDIETRIQHLVSETAYYQQYGLNEEQRNNLKDRSSAILFWLELITKILKKAIEVASSLLEEKETLLPVMSADASYKLDVPNFCHLLHDSLKRRGTLERQTIAQRATMALNRIDEGAKQWSEEAAKPYFDEAEGRLKQLQKEVLPKHADVKVTPAVYTEAINFVMTKCQECLSRDNETIKQIQAIHAWAGGEFVKMSVIHYFVSSTKRLPDQMDRPDGAAGESTTLHDDIGNICREIQNGELPRLRIATFDFPIEQSSCVDHLQSVLEAIGENKCPNLEHLRWYAPDCGMILGQSAASDVSNVFGHLSVNRLQNTKFVLELLPSHQPVPDNIRGNLLVDGLRSLASEIHRVGLTQLRTGIHYENLQPDWQQIVTAFNSVQTAFTAETQLVNEGDVVTTGVPSPLLWISDGLQFPRTELLISKRADAVEAADAPPEAAGPAEAASAE